MQLRPPVPRLRAFLMQWMLALLAASVCLGAWASAAAPTFSLGYCADPAGTLSLAQARSCDYKAFNDAVVGGPLRAARWVRISVQLPQPLQEGLRIEVGPHFLPDLRLYEQQAGQWRTQVAGAEAAKGEGRAVLGGYQFLVHPQGAGEVVYYLRAQAAGLTHVRVSVSPVSGADHVQDSLRVGLGMHLGGLVLMLVFALVSFALQPEALMGRFSVYVLNLILCLLAGSGILALAVFPGKPWLDIAFFHWMLCIRLGLWVWLSRAFLLDWRTPAWYGWLCRSVYGLVFVCLVLVALDMRAAIQGPMLLGIVAFSIGQIVVLFRTPGLHHFYRNALLASFVLTDLLIAIAALVVVFPVGNQDLPTLVSRLTDFATPLVVLAIIAFKKRLDMRELGRVRLALAETQWRAEMESRALAERRVLIDMLTHELKNPLASISLALGSLGQQVGEAGDAVQRRLRNIEHSIRNMDAVIEHCALVNRVDQKDLALRVEEVHLRNLIQKIITSQPEPHRFDLLVPEGLRVETDLHLLRIVLVNLVDNAVKYSPAASRITVAALDQAGDASGHLAIEVSNSVGESGSPDPLQVFEKYYRHPANHAQSGSGLGLYLVREICHMLGAAVRYRLDGQAVRFSVEFQP